MKKSEDKKIVDGEDPKIEKRSAAAGKKKGALKKIDPEASKLLQSFKDKANKKSFGRKVRDSEIIGKALSLLGPEHIVELQDSTLNERDRLDIAHDEYTKANGKISLDQFIGKLIRNELSLTQPKSLE